jgi:hypothetical protein
MCIYLEYDSDTHIDVLSLDILLNTDVVPITSQPNFFLVRRQNAQV